MTNASATTAIAMQAILASGVSLSVPADVYLEAALSAGELVAGAPVETLTEAAIEALPADFADAIGGAVAELADVVPAAAAFIKFMEGVISAPRKDAEAARAERAQDCREQFKKRAVVPSGSKLGGCEQCPADLFVRRTDWLGNGMLYRSMLGEALVCVTEGYPFDHVPEDVCARYQDVGKPCDPAYWEKYGADRRSLIWKKIGIGIYNNRRETFGKVRRAIEAAYRPPGTHGGDAGLAPWTGYLDLLWAEAQAGHISRKMMKYYLGATFTDDKRSAITVKTSEAECYYPALADAIQKLVDEWYNTAIDPKYDRGIAAVQGLKEYQARRRRGSLALAVRRRALAKSHDAAIRSAIVGPWATVKRALSTPTGKAAAIAGGLLLAGGAVASLANRRRS